MVLVILFLMIGLSAGTSEKRVIQASKVESIIRSGGPAEFDDCTILGDLDLSGLKIEQPVHFNHTIFQDSVNFESTTFNDTAYISSSVFNGTADFSSSTYNAEASFVDSTYNAEAYFGGAGFNDYAGFMGVGFNGDAQFGDARFNGTANFEGAGFNGGANFEGTGFNGGADFGGSKFKGVSFSDSEFNGYFDVFIDNNKRIFVDATAYFGDAEFNDWADFHYARFNGATIFDEVRFNGTAYFAVSRFNDSTVFRSAVFKDDAIFRFADFKYIEFVNTTFNITDFTGVQFDKDAHFEDTDFTGKTTFENARFKEDALFENASFEDELKLTRTRYSKMFIRWHSIEKGGLAYDDAAYMSLMKNFKDLGYFEDYDSCYFQYRKEHRGQPWPTVNDWEEWARKLIDYPLQSFYGYGTKPFNAFLWSLGIVIAFFLYWWWLGLGGPMDKTKDSLREGEEWLDGDVTDILGFSITVFLSGTKFFIDPPALPNIEGHSRSWIKKAFILERVLGALFSVLFFIAISGTIVRTV
jgi:hypothetical protein